MADGWGTSRNAADTWGAPPAVTNLSANAPVEKLTQKISSLTTDEESIPEPRHHALVENNNEIEIKLNEDNPQLYSSASTFQELGLSDVLLKGIIGMGFERPSRIQERALPLLLKDPPSNFIGQSQSGTGKTAAFVLTMLSRVDVNLKCPQAICLAPGRELARQIMEVVKEMGKYTDISFGFAIKESVSRGETLNAQVIVGTPGTVTMLLKQRALDCSKIRMFVLDEADNMLDQQGLGDQSIRIKNQMPRGCQIILFSATFPPLLKEFAARFAPKANTLMLRQEELSVDGIKQFYMDCKSEDHKIDVLQQIYGLLTIGQSIIFVRRREIADRLEKRLTDEGHEVTALHGGLTAIERDAVMDNFRSGKSKVLITTNVLARGIDIQQVNCVINFDMPVDGNNQPDAETYLHRIGRTGRFGRTGVSINFVHDQRSFMEMKAIEDHFGRQIIRVPTDNPMEIEKILKKAVN